MGMGDRLVKIVDIVCQQLDSTPQERLEMELLLQRAPEEFAEKYEEYIEDKEMLAVLQGSAAQ